MSQRKKSKALDPVKQTPCEYYCSGQNMAVTEIWYHPICDPCFRQLIRETTEAIHEELEKRR